MHRVFISPGAVRGQTITIDDPGELHHARDVLRVRIGEALECFDGLGHRYVGRVVQCDRVALAVAVERAAMDSRAAVSIGLAQALVRADRFEWTLQKATELGVARVIPVIAARSVVRPARERIGHQLARWQRIIQEAAKQCGCARLPAIGPPVPFEALIGRMSEWPHVLMPTLAVATEPISQALASMRDAEAVLVMIGPEGDFTPAEVEGARHAGARPVSLGQLTLRSETAALVAVTLVQWAEELMSLPGLMRQQGRQDQQKSNRMRRKHRKGAAEFS